METNAKIKRLTEDNEKLIKEIQFYKKKLENLQLSGNSELAGDNKFEIFESLPVGIFLFDSNFLVRFINSKALNILDLSQLEIQQTNLTKLNDVLLTNSMKQALDGHESFYEGYFKFKPQSPEVFVSLRLNVSDNIFFEGQKAGIAIIEDLTEQKLAENAIFKTYDIFQTVTDNIDALIFVSNIQKNEILFLNKNAINTFYDENIKTESKKKQRNKLLLEFINSENTQQLNLFDNIDYEYFEINQKKWYHVTCTKIKWIDEQEVFLLSSIDISLQKQTEILLLNQNEELENQTIELEKALLQLTEQNVQINSQADNLKSSNDTKDKMFSIIGHDLRGPVGNLKNALDLLIEEYAELNSEEIREFIETLRESSDSVFNLLANLLDWAKSQSGRLIFRPEEISLNEIIDENISLFGSNFVRKNIILSYNPTKDYKIFADENMITTVVRNLMSNALKFTNEGGRIEININETVRSNRNYTEITFKDNGIGIEKENLGKIFNSNEHFSTYGTNNEKGSGLGIILCKEFIDKHKGEIVINSEPGKGTAISFIIPTN